MRIKDWFRKRRCARRGHDFPPDNVAMRMICHRVCCRQCGLWIVRHASLNSDGDVGCSHFGIGGHPLTGATTWEAK